MPYSVTIARAILVACSMSDTARGRLAEHQFLGGAAAHREHQAGDHLRAGHQTLVVLGHRHRVPTGAAAARIVTL